MDLILILNENYCLYFIKEFNNSQEIPELSNHLLTTLANQNNGPFKLCLLIS